MPINTRIQQVAAAEYEMRRTVSRRSKFEPFLQKHRHFDGLAILAVVLLVFARFVVSPCVGAVGDPVGNPVSPDPPIENHFCSIGLAFDGSSLYFNRCFDNNIYEISPIDGSLRRIFPTGISELPAAMSYDAKKNGLWIGTLTGTGGVRPSTCNGVSGMPVYFWNFNDDSVTLMFTIPPTFFDRCVLEGLAYRENDPLRDDDDELWISDERSRTRRLRCSE